MKVTWIKGKTDASLFKSCCVREVERTQVKKWDYDGDATKYNRNDRN